MLDVRGIVPSPGPLLLVLDLRDKLECTGLASPLDLNSAVTYVLLIIIDFVLRSR